MKQAVMYGAGNIGRGFLGQLFHASGYEISFIDVNQSVIDRLNSDKQYPIFITDGDSYREYLVTGVRGVNGLNTEAIAETIEKADVMATAVGVNVLGRIALPIARGVVQRMKNGVEIPLNIIVCENMIGADHFLAEEIKKHLNDAEKIYFDAHVATVEPSIGRMVPATPDWLKEKHPLAVCVEPYCELPVDRDAFLGEIPPIVNLQPFSPFDFHIRRKLFMHNMSHALTAYFGALQGYTYIWEAAENSDIQELVRRALAEASQALASEYGVPIEELLAFGEQLIERFQNRLLGDTIERVGRDTKRKLASNDRFVATAQLCQKQGIMPVYVLSGLAAGLHFAPDGDDASHEVVNDLTQNGLIHTLQNYCGIEPDSNFVPVIESVYHRIRNGETALEIAKVLS